MYDFDVVYLGSGHAAWHGAVMLANAEKKVAVLDHDLSGGTCTNYGCDAKILLDGPFECIEALDRYKDICVDNVGNISWKKLMEYKKHHFAPFPTFVSNMLKEKGVAFIKERGKLIDAHTVQAGNQHITAENIVLAVGQRNARLDIPGKEFLHGSREFLDIEEMPEHLICIGAGIISMEFASMALTLGKKVSFFEFMPRALAAYPEKYVTKLVEKMTEQGADFHFGEAVCRVEKTDNGYKVTAKSGLCVEGDYVLDATGRVTNYEDLGLEELGIQASRRGIEVDDHLRTCVKNIYVSGDAINKMIPRLTPTAIYESNYIAAQILGLSDKPICYPAVPNLVFTLPRIAQVGMTIEEAEKKPEQYKVVDIPYGVQNEWINNRELDIDITFIIDTKGYLVGAAVYGSDAGTWIDFLTLIINKKITGQELESMIFAFPTHTYMLVSTLISLLNKEK
ncbi:MAG: NAD(P)/FAD-dependent oxidoreductase [Alphaproteobacteria bacterium]|nr:NAD(P)/FAD-dependent oxidoreductase [Alphaproteobacteria bacterium]